MQVTESLLIEIQANDKNLVELDFSQEKISKEELNRLVNALKQNTHIKCLKLCNNILGKEEADLLACPELNLKQLEMTNCGLSNLANTNFNNNLKYLNLANNRIDCETFNKLIQHPNLEKINLSNNNIDDSYLSEELFSFNLLGQGNIEFKSKKLHLSKNRISDKGLNLLLNSLFIEELDLNKNNVLLNQINLYPAHNYLVNLKKVCAQQNSELLSKKDLTNRMQDVIDNLNYSVRNSLSCIVGIGDELNKEVLNKLGTISSISPNNVNSNNKCNISYDDKDYSNGAKNVTNRLFLTKTKQLHTNMSECAQNLLSLLDVSSNTTNMILSANQHISIPVTFSFKQIYVEVSQVLNNLIINQQVKIIFNCDDNGEQSYIKDKNTFKSLLVELLSLLIFKSNAGKISLINKVVNRSDEFEKIDIEISFISFELEKSFFDPDYVFSNNIERIKLLNIINFTKVLNIEMKFLNKHTIVLSKDFRLCKDNTHNKVNSSNKKFLPFIPKRILVVDDIKMQQKITSNLVSHAGHLCKSVTKGSEAMKNTKKV